MIARAFLQIATILAVCYVLSLLAKRVRQPPVIAQLIGGLVIGPSLLGMNQSWGAALFAPATLAPVQVLGQVGVTLYMFTIGASLDLDVVRRTARTGISVALSGMLVPLACGALLGLLLVHDSRLFPASAAAPLAALYLAAALAVTAFPVMARIIEQHNLMGASFASLSLACGCFSDAVAWCLVAIVVAGMAGSAAAGALTLAGAVALGVALFAVVRPILRRIAARAGERDTVLRLEPVVLIVLMVVAFLAEGIGIHPAFGAFLLGTALPRGRATEALCQRIGPLTSELLLPLFFAYAGLSVHLNLVNRIDLVLLTIAICVVASVAKGVSCTVAARLSGQTTTDAVAIGALMNARGLVELIVASIGLQRHVITLTMYAVLVIMTIVTTMTASPILTVLFGTSAPGGGGQEATQGETPAVPSASS